MTMMSSLDEEWVFDLYVEDRVREETRKTERATAERVIRMGKMSLEDISECFSSLSLDELKEIEAEVMQPS